jgi:3-dehydroquinate synthase II
LKELWLQIDPKTQEKEKLFRAAQESADVVVENGKATFTSSKQEITILAAFDADEIRKLKHDDKKVAVKVAIKGKGDEDSAVQAAKLGADYVIIDCRDWRVIPLENLIARVSGKSKLIAEVANSRDAQLVSQTLELGTDGVLLTTGSAEEFSLTAAIAKSQTPKIALVTAKVVAVSQMGTGARVCVDTCDLMEPGEGMLVGSQSAGLFLVEAEVHENPYVAARPFRVNAGSLSMYTLGQIPSTRYLSELKAGDEVLIVNREGKVRKTNVGRTKTEFRPLMLIEAEVEGTRIKTVLQNAETIRLVTPDGSTPVTSIKTGDQVVVHVAAKGGRHFGVSVPNEKVIER